MEKTTSGELENIVSCLMTVDPYRVVLFGSAVAGKRELESDFDLLVVLDSEVVPRTYEERMEVRTAVRKSIREINRNIPVDLVVYTRAEYDLLRKQGASFLSRIESTGKALYEKSSKNMA